MSGNVTGNLTGNQSGGTISATTGAFTGAVTIGGVSNVDILPTGDATFAGTVAAASFSGNASSATTATNVSGVVAIANGGTGASDAATALFNLGGTNASNLTSGTLATILFANNTFPSAALQNLGTPEPSIQRQLSMPKACVTARRQFFH